jgi:hypothetical protein
MLGLLLDVPVPTLMYVLWKVMRVTAIELWFLDSEHLYWSYYGGGAVAKARSAITFLIITLMLQRHEVQLHLSLSLSCCKGTKCNYISHYHSHVVAVVISVCRFHKSCFYSLWVLQFQCTCM